MAMDPGINDKVAVVTGGTSGIGLETVRLFLACGARVAFCGRDERKLQLAAERLALDYPPSRYLAVPCDVLSEPQVQRFAEEVESAFGGVDMLVNNAGRGRQSTFADTTDDDWREELELKFFSVIRPTRAFLPALKRSPCASIVCVNSLLAVQPEPHMVATSAARAGVLNLARSLATEFAPFGIRVNSILLGTVNSGQWEARYRKQAPAGVSFEDWLGQLAAEKRIPLGRFGAAIEPARAIVYLASPLSSYTTGASLDVSGGMARHI